ncbi:CDP-glucose 4,6-dehydratase [Synechococcus sp. HJ21-Hayes]|nr:CDP-glucose 4,6-dehydratase [Synechococcus sp. JJ3a-Johnson]MCP9852102.1 CDP-glucose 4,6-dehydratase [Synechococcus sp. HJ21-Hayes]
MPPFASPNPEFWTQRRVLLTGHTGFKGSWLALWLHHLGAQVHGVALPPETNPDLFAQLNLSHRLAGHQLHDIDDAKGLTELVVDVQPEIVLHLAAQPLVRRSYYDPLQTWSTNVMGSLHLLEALKSLRHPCAVVMVTTDKVYANQEWDYGYREEDRLGGHDPYSASKAAAELAISSWRASFCGTSDHQTPYLAIATARAGNVIGGGDWACDRLIPDAMRALCAGKSIPVRSPKATRPWQHVLDPLAGYLRLAERLHSTQSDLVRVSDVAGNRFMTAFNFGPSLEGNRTVVELIKAVLGHWPGEWVDLSDPSAPHEASRLHLQIDKAHHQLGWQPRWDFATTVARTVGWYCAVHEGANPLDCCLADLEAYQEQSAHAH